ncbi:MAG: UDP-N-acetylmuramoyl-L-alanine--D-glutamate ligase, partial [Proteobacteria bacterium]|nr:UDP-N-acetylmuramoyl-L-alanine--D-glutamate ligase [Pseudomonadota bacterium]
EVIATLGLNVMAAVNHLKSFQPLPHRFEKVALINGVEYINDSIATNPFAVNVALKTVNCANTLLLLGGFDRMVDWQWFVDVMQLNPPKAVLCNGQNGFKLHKLLKTNKINSRIYYFADLKSAVIEAILQAKTGDIVLLSPGSPSFDAFDNYQHRGVKFTKWVKLNTK